MSLQKIGEDKKKGPFKRPGAKWNRIPIEFMKQNGLSDRQRILYEDLAEQADRDGYSWKGRTFRRWETRFEIKAYATLKGVERTSVHRDLETLQRKCLLRRGERMGQGILVTIIPPSLLPSLSAAAQRITHNLELSELAVIIGEVLINNAARRTGPHNLAHNLRARKYQLIQQLNEYFTRSTAELIAHTDLRTDINTDFEKPTKTLADCVNSLQPSASVEPLDAIASGVADRDLGAERRPSASYGPTAACESITDLARSPVASFEPASADLYRILDPRDVTTAAPWRGAVFKPIPDLFLSMTRSDNKYRVAFAGFINSRRLNNLKNYSEWNRVTFPVRADDDQAVSTPISTPSNRPDDAGGFFDPVGFWRTPRPKPLPPQILEDHRPRLKGIQHDEANKILESIFYGCIPDPCARDREMTLIFSEKRTDPGWSSKQGTGPNPSRKKRMESFPAYTRENRLHALFLWIESNLGHRMHHEIRNAYAYGHDPEVIVAFCVNWYRASNPVKLPKGRPRGGVQALENKSATPILEQKVSGKNFESAFTADFGPDFFEKVRKQIQGAGV